MVKAETSSQHEEQEARGKEGNAYHGPAIRAEEWPEMETWSVGAFAIHDAWRFRCGVKAGF